MPAEELRTIVIYDIADDRVRTRISETCLDYGLARIQYSAFLGSLTRNKREEIFMKLRRHLEGGGSGRILVQPVCLKDSQDALEYEVEAPGGGPA